MSVKVTTPSKTGFIGDGKRSPLKSQEMSLANKLDNIASSIALECPRSFDGVSEQSKRERIGSSASRHAAVIKRSRRSSEKGGPPTPHIASSKKRTPKFEKQKEKIKLPTKFLLGGNITDPLNLNSMNDEEINKALNAETPVSSPLPTPSHRNQKVEVLIPPNINDPLNLNSGEDLDMALVSPRASAKKRKKNKRKKSTEPVGTGNVGDLPVPEVTQPEKDFSSQLTLQIDTKIRHVIDEIVSPAIPQDSPKPKRKRTISDSKANVETEEESPTKGVEKATKVKKPLAVSAVTTKPLKFRPSDNKFSHGNYNRYYGKRNPEMEDDRLSVFQKEWFEGKDVLDIGCNIGHVTLSVARDFGPNNITGMDIDGKLISIARKNVRYYMSTELAKTSKFPVSLPSTFGPIAAPAVTQDKKFPQNVDFVQGNYVLDNDELLEIQKEEYDVIMALSITKWLHLNYGDDGLKRCFRRMFRQLRPGGKLILEPQSWSSYKKKKKLNETIWKNFKAIELKPDQFKKYLFTEVGFSKCEYLDIPFNKSKGFQRPILMLTKPDTSHTTPREVTESRGVTPLMNIECSHHSYTPRFAGYDGTPSQDIHPSYSFSSTHMPIRGNDAFLESGQMGLWAFTPTQELISVSARGNTPRFDIGTPSVSARNTPSQPLNYSDSEGQWSQEGELFEHLSDSGSRLNSIDCRSSVDLSSCQKDGSLSQSSSSALTDSQPKSTENTGILSTQSSSIANTSSQPSSSEFSQTSVSSATSSGKQSSIHTEEKQDSSQNNKDFVQSSESSLPEETEETEKTKDKIERSDSKSDGVNTVKDACE